ncbi:hypothetical protein ACFXS9_00065 [Bradyrhizobium sp. RDI18]
MSKFSFRYAGLAALAAACMASASVSAEETPKPADILFERLSLRPSRRVRTSSTSSRRTPSDPKTLGPGFSDNITLTVERAMAARAKKNVRLQIYSGDRARDPQEITDMDGNPLLVVYLDDAVAHFRLLAGGDGAYLKNMFKKSLAQDAKIAPVKIDAKGQSVDGFA